LAGVDVGQLVGGGTAVFVIVGDVVIVGDGSSSIGKEVATISTEGSTPGAGVSVGATHGVGKLFDTGTAPFVASGRPITIEQPRLVVNNTNSSNVPTTLCVCQFWEYTVEITFIQDLLHYSLS
jgi:hypothetical protein